MRHTIELAAYFFRRGEFVLGNDVLKDEYRKWADDYILGFFEGAVGNPDAEHLPGFSKHPRILGMLDGFDSINHYEREDTKC